MDVANAVNLLINVTNSAANLLTQSGVISTLIQKANSENRTTFTAEEWATITGADDAARTVLQEAIAKAAAS